MAKKDIDYVNADYIRLKEKWDIVDDICDINNEKSYIEYLNPKDLTSKNVSRNNAYKNRAVFYGIASFTRRGLLGLMFRKWPKLSIPPQIQYIERNIDGEGNSIYQQSQQVAKSVIGKGKCGLLVDYPPVEGEASQEDINTLRYVSTIKLFEPQQILLPVETYSLGAEIKLKRIRLSTSVEEGLDVIPVIRVLEIVDGVYFSSEYREAEQGWELYKSVAVKDSSGNYLSEIPFVFIGSETNNKNENMPPMYDICKINIGHLNNSAAYEDSVFTVGQVQPCGSGITVADIKEMEAEGMYWGSGRLIGTADPSAKYYLLQAAPNMIAREAMDKKVEDIVGLGGMFIQPGSAVKTATQSDGEQKVQHSVLSLIASNISEGYTEALSWMCRFMGVNPPSDMEYTTNQDYINNTPDAQMFTAMLQGVMSGKYTQRAFIEWQKKMEIEDADRTVEEIKEELSLESPSTESIDLSGDD